MNTGELSRSNLQRQEKNNRAGWDMSEGTLKKKTFTP